MLRRPCLRDHAGVGVSCWGDAVGAGHDGRLAPAAERSLCGATTGQPPNAVSTESLAGFPRYGKSYAIMTNGCATLADHHWYAGRPGCKDSGVPLRGTRDLNIVRLVVRVPQSANCLSFRFRYLSQEFPQFVGSQYNDGFIAELDYTGWSWAQRSQRSSHHSPPRLRQGRPREHHHDQLRWSGGLYESQRGRYGLRWRDQDLARLHPDHRGDALLFLSIFDQGDRSYDSAVFLDNLTINHRASCQSGVAATQ